MKSFKYLVVLVCLIMALFGTEAKGQVYSSGAEFYLLSDADPNDPNGGITICRFDGNQMFIVSGIRSAVCKQLAESSSYYDNLDENSSSKNLKGIYDGRRILLKIDKGFPSSSRTVYSTEYWYQGSSSSRQFIAVSEDKSSIVDFTMDCHREKVLNKVYRIRINKEDLLSKSINPNELDFLNE